MNIAKPKWQAVTKYSTREYYTWESRLCVVKSEMAGHVKSQYIQSIRLDEVSSLADLT